MNSYISLKVSDRKSQKENLQVKKKETEIAN